MSYEELSNYDLLGFGLNIKANLMHVQYEHAQQRTRMIISFWQFSLNFNLCVY